MNKYANSASKSNIPRTIAAIAVLDSLLSEVEGLLDGCGGGVKVALDVGSAAEIDMTVVTTLVTVLVMVEKMVW
ncbi:hypothetical protein IWW57_006137, partial [Coemansia sp. S610]